jgi:hypothetical protein
MLDLRTAQTELEDAIRDAILYALGRRLPVVADAAALRLLVTQGSSGCALTDDALILCTALGSFRWSNASTAADDGTTVIKPADVPGAGRWLLWTSPLRIALAVGGDSCYLHELASGPLASVQTLDKAFSDDEVMQLVQGQTPAVLIEANDDEPTAATGDEGRLWFVRYTFTVSVVAQNLRPRRQAAQDPGVGANAIDGWIASLLGGTQLAQAVEGVRDVKLGKGMNWISDLMQRRVIRERTYSVLATVENPQAPNEIGPAAEVAQQSQMTDLGDQDVFDPRNFIASGLDVRCGAGLVQTVRAGSAVVGGAAVTYAGELHTFGASTDTYRDLGDDGTLHFIEVASGEPAPALTAGALRIARTTTDGSGVVDDHSIAATYTPYMNPLETPLS